ncbi:large neutral amino acids transporter small subunit 1-like [Sycon ciliatum]|uniref:large neutral amino acids transporter small subunit 1-like n=1 Tax=Sycon ciliatum TaxID=27933 RepID=UPI0020ADF6CA
MDDTDVEGGSPKRHLSLRNGIGLVVGGIIGSGIFLTPNGVLEQSGSVGAALAIWILAGLLSMGGALCYCELGTCIPETGGEHAYFRRAFGPLSAFTFTWSLLLVVCPVSNALISLTFARYAIKPFYGRHAEVPGGAEERLAVLAIAALTIINCISAKWATRIADSFTALKLVAIGFLVLLGAAWVSKGNVSNFNEPFANTTLGASSFNLAFFQAIYPFTGWNYLNYVAGEMTDPARDLPLAVVYGLCLVILCYLLCNLSYFAILSKKAILETKAIAVESMVKVIGDAGLILGPLFVATSCWGAANSSIYTAGRVGHAAALEGHMPKIFALVHRQFGTPFISLLFQGAMGISFILLVDMTSLVLVFGFLTWTFFGMAFLAVLRLRQTEPDLERPYKVNKFLAVFMVAASALLVLSSLSQFPRECVGAIGFLLVGALTYYLLVKRQFAEAITGQFSDRCVLLAQRLLPLELSTTSAK